MAPYDALHVERFNDDELRLSCKKKRTACDDLCCTSLSHNSRITFTEAFPTSYHFTVSHSMDFKTVRASTVMRYLSILLLLLLSVESTPRIHRIDLSERHDVSQPTALQPMTASTFSPSGLTETIKSMEAPTHVALDKAVVEARNLQYFGPLQKPDQAPSTQPGKRDSADPKVTETRLYPRNKGTEFSTGLKVEDMSVNTTVDTASSDTWFVKKGFQCFGPDGNEQNYEACRFGPPVDIEGDVIPDQHFNISYSSNEWLIGKFIYATVAINGAEVKRQKVCS